MLAGQLVAEVAVGSPIKLAHLAIRLPSIVTRLRRLILACEAMLQQFASAESRLLAGMALDAGAITGLVPNLPVRIERTDVMGITGAPKSMADFADRLARVDSRAAPTIAIEKYANGVIAYLPGTKSAALGWDSDPMDMKTNLQAILGRQSNVEIGLAAALGQAGVTPGERIMVVGHSQGGLVAVTAAERAKLGKFPYSIERVVTFGSPVAGTEPKFAPKLLSVENTSDVVPNLAIKRNPSSPNWLTIEQKTQGDPISSHLIGAYQHTALQIDANATQVERNYLSQFTEFANGEGKVSYFELRQGESFRAAS